MAPEIGIWFRFYFYLFLYCYGCITYVDPVGNKSLDFNRLSLIQTCTIEHELYLHTNEQGGSYTGFFFETAARETWSLP